MAKLITGGTGYIGAELARRLASRGEEVVLFDIVINHDRIRDIENQVKVVRGDLGNSSEVFNVVNENQVTEIYHLGSMLTSMSEIDPWASFQTNVIGTYNVLEAARLFKVKKMIFTSTLGTFGLDFPPVLTDTTLQRPVTMYGCGKLYCEGLGRFYRNKFGLDFRSIRFAHMVGPHVRTPGHWAPPMIEDAILGRPHECVQGTPESVASMIYVRDAALAVDLVLESPAENIKMVNYNVAGLRGVVSAREVETTLRKFFPATRVSYQPVTSASAAVSGTHSILKDFDDSCAREEWGWQPLYNSLESLIDIFQKDLVDHPD